jgi:hypothetical protein
MICPRCKNEHHGEVKTCDYCRSVMGSPSPWARSDIRTASTDAMDEHIQDHLHENDYQSDGGWIE